MMRPIGSTMIFAFAPLVAVGGVVAATSAAANSVSISARASTVCVAEVSDPPPSRLEAGETSLGRLTELCNSAEGYRLVVRHPSGLEGASIRLDGERIALDAGATQTVITDSPLPRARDRSFAISVASAVELGELAVEIQPAGPIF